MGLYPEAIKKLIPENKTQKRQNPKVVAMHTAVDGAKTTSMYGYITSPGVGTDFHFYVRKDGQVEQYLDTNVGSDAMSQLDDKVIVIETWDGLASSKADPEKNPWTPSQVQAITALLDWICAEHSIQRELLAPNDRYTSSKRWTTGVNGITYHSQPVRNPATLSMESGYNPYTHYQGKTCPGRARVSQLVKTIIPAVAKGEGGGVIAEPQPIPIGQYGVAILGMTDFGPAVEKLQQVLNQRHKGGLDVDGDFGLATDAAVRKAQAELRVVVDGLWGPATAAASWKDFESRPTVPMPMPPPPVIPPPPAPPAPPVVDVQAEFDGLIDRALALTDTQVDSWTEFKKDLDEYNARQQG